MTLHNDNANWQQLTEQGVNMLRQGHADGALGQLIKAKTLAPNQRDVNYWLANAYRKTGNLELATQIFEQLLNRVPADVEVSLALAFLWREKGAHVKAGAVLLKAAQQRSVTVEQLLTFTGFLHDTSQFDSAISVLTKVIERQPQQAELHYKLARLYQSVGDFARAHAELKTVLNLQPSMGPAWLTMAQQKHFDSVNDEDFIALQRVSEQVFERDANMCIAFAYGKALDDLAHYKRAWLHYQNGNVLRAQSATWDPTAWNQVVAQASAEVLAAPSKIGSKRNAVLIVGMLRSGTTLLEQVLHRHPHITGRGELNLLSQFAQHYNVDLSARQKQEIADILWAQIRMDGDESHCYIDKNPLNFRYVPMFLSLLSDAKVIHVSRDGRDSCLSCFFQLFEHDDAAFSNNLDHLVSYYAGYRKLMSRWIKLFPERIFTVSYQQLVGENQASLKEIIEFLGCDWNDAVLRLDDQARVVRTASVWQARQPLHTRSLARWRNYYDLAPKFFDQIRKIDEQYQ